MTSNRQKNNFLTLNPKTSQQLTVYGLPYFESERTFLRVSESDFDIVSQISDTLATLTKNTAGGFIAFYGIARHFSIKVTGLKHFHMSHMAYTGQAGFDLYMGHNLDDLSFFKTTTFNVRDDNYQFTFFDNLNHSEQLFILNFPLYAGVEDVELIFNEDATIKPCDLFSHGRIVFYGTSITQGGCASRPGMSYPALVSRATGYEAINYGFSGSGKGEKAMAELVAKIPKVKLFVLDYEANSDENQILHQTLEPFIETIRIQYPTTPILIISKIKMSKEHHSQEMKDKFKSYQLFQKQLVKRRRAQGDNIFFLNGENFMAPIYHEATVDGIHPTDLGFYLMATKIIKKTKAIMSNTDI